MLLFSFVYRRFLWYKKQLQIRNEEIPHWSSEAEEGASTNFLLWNPDTNVHYHVKKEKKKKKNLSCK